MRTKGNVWRRRALWGAAAIAGLVGWVQFLWPPIAYYQKSAAKPDGADVLGELLKPTNAIYDEPLLGWAFVALTLVLSLFVIHWSRVIADYLQHSRVGISILDTQMEIQMQDAARSMAIGRRTQTFHANRRGITAYHFGARTDSATGRIVGAQIIQASHVGNRRITREVLSRGSETSVDAIEVFDRELPTNIFATYLPNWLVCMLHGAGLFQDTVITRTGETTYQNEFDGREGVYSVSSTKYPISRTSIRVAFVAGFEPQADNVRGFLIRENVVEEVALTTSRTQTHVIFEARAGTMLMESLRIQWTFP